jgi:UDP-glucose 4-epimerase
MKERILVTGGAGFMGSHIVDVLIASGYDVYSADDLSGGYMRNVNPKAKFFKIDLGEAKKNDKLIQKVKPEIIFYLAANAREGASQFQPSAVTYRNFYAYITTLKNAIKYKTLRKIILFSSMAVYGNQKPPFDETMERKPEDIYGVNKAAMERSTEVLSSVHDFAYTIIRPHNVFGERQSLSDKFRNVIGIFMNRIMRKEPLLIYGDGEQVRAFSYIFDSLPCYIKCLDGSTNDEIINIGGIEKIAINKLADIVCEAMGVKDYPREYLPSRPCEVKYAYCTYEKSQRLLGYKEEIGYEEGIRRMAKWAKEMGPQEWTTEKLELHSEKAPTWWYE